MYIKSITLEGFKSYGQRTQIEGFDAFFNAITGLNGSGKSNILDGICFLLGISNLSQVRASSLQELVYKNGQAGIMKASVSVTFDNSNKKQSPVGYDQYNEITVTRQVVIGGRNKYIINGCIAQNSRVQDLFRSVQMNVNNPHFLIMQGRVTKVLNMKPPEILSMLEEAAGTKMYESKKQVAQKTIEKKDLKLKEIELILKEDITPTLTRLKDERAQFLEYQKIERELEHLTKLCVAFQYITEEKLSKQSKNDLEKMAETIKELETKYDEAKIEKDETQKTTKTLIEKRDNDSGDVLKKLQEALIDQEKKEAEISSNVQSKKDYLQAEIKKRTTLEKNRSEDTASIESKVKELEKLDSDTEGVKTESAADAEALNAARKHFQAISSGLSTNEDGQAASLADQLMGAKDEIATAETERKQAKMMLDHVKPDLKKKEAELKTTEREYEKDQAAIQPHRDRVAKLETELRQLGFQEGEQQQLVDARRVLQTDTVRLRDNVEAVESRFPQVSFEYSNPEPNFDRRKVEGLVCTLFTVKDPKYATALEVVAGGKLYNVVVDNEMTGKLILERGNLRKRHTIIPLNKITGYPIRNDIIAKAQRLVGQENVCTALSLIDYDRRLTPAMEFVFGNVLVCTNMDVAKRVTYDRDIMKRTVTLDGEVFDPAGTLSGGSRRPGPPVLSQLTQLKVMKEELTVKMRELQHIEKNLANMRTVSEKFKELKREHELRQHELNLVEQRLQQGSHHRQLEDVQILRQTIEEQEAVLKRCDETQKKAEKKVKDIEEKRKNSALFRERELKEAEKRVADCQKQSEASYKKMKEVQQVMEILRLELEDLKKSLSKYDDQIGAVNEAIAGYEKQIVELEETNNAIKAKVEKAKTALKSQKDLLKSRDSEISDLQKKIDTLRREMDGNKLKTKELTLEMTKLQTSSKDAKNRLHSLKAKFDWIEEEKKYFGQSNTAYDFEANNPQDAKRRLNKLHEDKEKLSKNVNMRAMTMLGKTEEQYNDLMKKKKIVENDKAKIATVIHELDEKKKEALQTAWVKVNEDFGSIFTSLLPGTQAKLQPPEGMTVLDGLEFKVAFGNKWKESLSELSGGQRSLVALSLILAMLRFKPAPIYILDEVDAALDLAHTQNIGNMLKTHFRHSQFIIVSLKDGMFNNANVLFKTKFIDGMSTVSRHTTNDRSHHNRSSR